MTLNITVATSRYIFQCADYCLLDWVTNKTFESDTHKILLANRMGWTASVCFAGVGHTHTLDVGQWLTERIKSLGPDEKFEGLLDALQHADEWLVDVEPKRRRHTFTVGAFVGRCPLVAYVSNIEALRAPQPRQPLKTLLVTRMRPREATTFVTGMSSLVTRTERQKLARLADSDPHPARMYEAMAEVVRSVSVKTKRVSQACFATHMDLTGKGGGAAFGSSKPRAAPLSQPGGDMLNDALTELVERRLGTRRTSIRQFATARVEPTEEYHQTLLQEQPADPDTHNNYGAFLKDFKHDPKGAERAYERALQLDDGHQNALSNLANLKWENGEVERADALYRKALERPLLNWRIARNYARLLDKRGDSEAAAVVLEEALRSDPTCGALHLELGGIRLLKETQQGPWLALKAPERMERINER